MIRYLLAAIILCAPMKAQGWIDQGSPRTIYVKHKAGHALVGLGVYEIGKHFGHPKMGLAIAWGLGIGKELYDQKHGGKFRTGDVAWTGGPATLTFVVRW